MKRSEQDPTERITQNACFIHLCFLKLPFNIQFLNEKVPSILLGIFLLYSKKVKHVFLPCVSNWFPPPTPPQTGIREHGSCKCRHLPPCDTMTWSQLLCTATPVNGQEGYYNFQPNRQQVVQRANRVLIWLFKAAWLEPGPSFRAIHRSGTDQIAFLAAWLLLGSSC